MKLVAVTAPDPDLDRAIPQTNCSSDKAEPQQVWVPASGELRAKFKRAGAPAPVLSWIILPIFIQRAKYISKKVIVKILTEPTSECATLFIFFSTTPSLLMEKPTYTQSVCYHV